MKKSLLLFATASVLITLTGCTTQQEAPKNYYGVQNDNANVSKDAYTAFGCTLLVLVVLIAWGIKKIKGKK